MPSPKPTPKPTAATKHAAKAVARADKAALQARNQKQGGTGAKGVSLAPSTFVSVDDIPPNDSGLLVNPHIIRHPALAHPPLNGDSAAQATLLGSKSSNGVGHQIDPAKMRKAQALDLRAAGYGYREIGEQLGVSTRTAYMDVQEALTYHARLTAIQAEQVRELELTRLDQLQTGVWPEALRGDPFAAQTALKIMERRAKLLGIDAPEEKIVTHRPLQGESTDDLQRRRAQLLSRLNLPPDVAAQPDDGAIDAEFEAKEGAEGTEAAEEDLPDVPDDRDARVQTIHRLMSPPEDLD